MLAHVATVKAKNCPPYSITIYDIVYILQEYGKCLYSESGLGPRGGQCCV